MPASTQVEPAFETVLPDEQATRQLARELGAMLRPGDVVALSGDLGAGKSTFARALIRQLAGDDELEVPSPTFTLLQAYELPAFALLHVDLYRLGTPDELRELGLPELAEGAVMLMEWPERAGDALPAQRLEIALALAPELGPDARQLRVSAHGPVGGRAAQLLNFHRFMHESGFGGAARERMQGDASTRLYERLRQSGRDAVLMVAPRRPDGPPVRDGKPYSAIAHLAEDVVPFVAIARGLRERGFSAPELYAADLADGLLILEDLGTEPVVAGVPPAPIEERYAAAVDTLVALHRLALPAELPVAPRVTYRVPRYDIEAFMIEVELLPDWYLPQQQYDLPDAARADYVALWRSALAAAEKAAPTWVLRDFHSPNLLWLPQREGAARIGLLDFQDALLGPSAYDVVSLLQDARVDVPKQLEDTLVGRYMKGRRAADRDFDLGEFIELYALMGAQRAAKILGIFARLDRRDGKPQYLRHQPRIWRNLRRSLSHPSLAGLKAWFDAHVPPPK